MKNKTVRWWDKLGEPQYGGEIVVRANSNIVDFDPCATQLAYIFSAWMEKLAADDWTLDPEIFDFKPHWHPSRYMAGQLAESWEFTRVGNYTVHLRKGVHWQNIPPANGREFVADDVVFHYSRLCGFGQSNKKRGPMQTAVTRFQDLVSVTASDKYTVVFQWKIASEETIMETLHQISPAAYLENPEAVRKWGDVRDWHHAIGTGPFILKDFIPGESAFLVNNHDYWGHDERHPQNQLPYVDAVKFLVIPDEAAALDLMCAGKIDLIDQVSPLGAQALRKTNPEIVQVTHPGANPVTIDPRNDVKPFNDIRVRKAMQMAIDLPTIVREYYHDTVEPYPATFTTRYMREWGFHWEDWPEDLKDEYTYNPKAAKKLLAEAGYPNGFKTNIVAHTSGEFPLLKIVQSYFQAIGIDMEIRPMESDDWIIYVMINHQHDQLAYHAGGPLGHNSSPTHDLRIFQKGSRANYNMVDDPLFNAFLPRAAAATSFAEIQKVMRDANEHVARQHYTISLIQPMAYSFYQPWLKGYNAQFGSAWAHGGGPGMSGFYLSRFWVDQKLKKI